MDWDEAFSQPDDRGHRRTGGGNQPPDQSASGTTAESRARAVEDYQLTQAVRYAEQQLAPAPTPTAAQAPVGLGPVSAREGAKRSKSRRRNPPVVPSTDRSSAAVQNAASTASEAEVLAQAPALVEERLLVAAKLNDVYTAFALNREKRRGEALKQLSLSLAKLGGSISAVGMTGEVKEFVTTLLMLEKVVPVQEEEQTGASPITFLSDWLNGKGDLEGEFDATT